MTEHSRRAPPGRRTAAAEPDPVEGVVKELIERHPHLRAAREAMRAQGVVADQFAQDALSAFRQRFRS